MAERNAAPARASGVPGLFPCAAPALFARLPAVRDTDVPSVADSASVLADSAVSLSDETIGPLSSRDALPAAAHHHPGRFPDPQEARLRGHGPVYLAQQRSVNRLIALKVLSKALASQQPYVQRFFREAGVLNRLDHDNIVGFHGVGEEKGLHYFAMEFIDGFTLAGLQERAAAAWPSPTPCTSRCKWPAPSATPTNTTSSTAMSSRATSWSTDWAASRSPTWAWPSRWTRICR